MKTPLNQIKSDAEALAKELPNLLMKVAPSSASHLGAASRRQSGQGEDFWQYRKFSHEDSADRVDWRRSARGDELFVRETELETARNFLFWVDPSDGFDWKGSPDVPTKASRALTILTALSHSIANTGDRCGALGSKRKPNIGSKAAINIAEDLWNNDASSALPAVNKTPATIVIASDFYRPLEETKNWIQQLASNNQTGILLMVYDPIEASYPFKGRINFLSPNNKRERLVGRAENLKQDYLARFSKRQTKIKELANSIGWYSAFHSTEDNAGPTLAHIAHWLSVPLENQGSAR